MQATSQLVEKSGIELVLRDGRYHDKTIARVTTTGGGVATFNLATKSSAPPA